MTAHPDDEAMFFGPALLCRKWGQSVHLLCLSTGDADGLGSVRKKELVGAAEIFGIPPDFVEVTDDPELKDGMDTVWSPAKIEEIVLAEVLKKRIHTVLTFDEVRSRRTLTVPLPLSALSCERAPFRAAALLCSCSSAR